MSCVQETSLPDPCVPVRSTRVAAWSLGTSVRFTGAPNPASGGLTATNIDRGRDPNEKRNGNGLAEVLHRSASRWDTECHPARWQ